jgi:hypothetical protein
MGNSFKISSVVLISMLLAACLGSNETRSPAAEANKRNDTIITVTKDGKSIELQIPRDSFLIAHVLKIDSVMKAYKGKPLEKKINSLIDVTGDGKPEEIIVSIWMEGDTCRVNHIIRKEGKAVWDKKLTIDASYGEAVYQDTTGIYEKLWPYSGFTAGTWYTNVADNETLSPDYIDDAVTMELRGEELRNKGLNEAAVQDEMERFRKYLESFKGHVVYEPAIMDGGVYVWYEPEKQFVLLYEP